MLKILHTADWHLDAPLQLQNEDVSRQMRQKLLEIPHKIAALSKAQNCDLVLISGDIFDGAYSPNTLRVLKSALEEMAVPVFIAPGNHDFVSLNSPWLTEEFPENAHIFKNRFLEFVDLPELDCRVYGAAFTAMECPGLLEGFRAESEMGYNICVLHGDPGQASSVYCPITMEQVRSSGLDYLALGHIHKGDRFMAGKTLCAWPGCPMGRGYDEDGEKGVLTVSLDGTATAAFLPLDVPRFYDLEVTPEALSDTLPPLGNDYFYRITLIGASEPLDLAALQAEYSRFPNLLLRDRTLPPVDVWSTAGQDTFEGMYFKLLHDAMESGDEETQRRVRIAAEISRQILDGQEVVLP